MKKLFDSVKRPILVSVVLLVVCGFAYPLLMTGLAGLFFPHQAGGSLIEVDGKIVGSSLVGQDFTEDFYMKCRPSAVNYNTYTQEQKEGGEYTGVGSGSANLGPTNPALLTRVQEDMKVFLEKNPKVSPEDIPTDLLTASGSGLDPHISPASANIQLDALVVATGMSMEALQDIVEHNTQGKGFGIFGEESVNVLGVNLEIAKFMGKV